MVLNVNLQYVKSVIGLSIQMAKSQFINRVEGTWLGVLYYLLGPLVTFLIVNFIFASRVGTDIENYPLYLLIGILLFNFFRSASTFATTLVKMRAGILKSIAFPKESLVVSHIAVLLFSHFFEFILLVVFFLFYGVPLYSLLFYPLILILLLVLTTGIMFLFTAIGAFLFDFEKVWEYAVPLIWLATPIFYAVEEHSILLYLNYFNPMYFIITFARDVLIYPQMPSILITAGSVGYSVGLFIIGIVVFAKYKKKFAELV